MEFIFERLNFTSTSYHIIFCLSFKHHRPITDKKSQLFLMNENKRIDNPRMKIVKSVNWRYRALEKEMRWNTTKANNGRHFQYTKFTVIDLVFTDKFRQTTLDWEWWRLRCSFINLTEWCERQVTFSSWLAISNTREKIRYFFTCVVADSLRVGSSCTTP